MENHSTPIIELTDIGKSYGNIKALRGISLAVRSGEVTCVLGDNGAGKSSLISVISGLRQHDTGTYAVDGKAVKFNSPREALDLGISAVYQTLALVPLLPIWRNFFLGSEITTGKGIFKHLDVKAMYEIADRELRRMGIKVADLNQPVGTLSGGQR